MRDRQTAVIEIVEENPASSDELRGIIKPNSVRINGVPLWAPADQPIVVHEIKLNATPNDDAPLQVTLTLWARRVFLGHSDESPEPTPEPAGDEVLNQTSIPAVLKGRR